MVESARDQLASAEYKYNELNKARSTDVAEHISLKLRFNELENRSQREYNDVLEKLKVSCFAPAYALRYYL